MYWHGGILSSEVVNIHRIFVELYLHCICVNGKALGDQWQLQDDSNAISALIAY
jgi:hypothetical protein